MDQILVGYIIKKNKFWTNFVSFPGRLSPLSDDGVNSLSVNCENEPSEVIVSGSNVKSVSG